jgi:hypothetical protein
MRENVSAPIRSARLNARAQQPVDRGKPEDEARAHRLQVECCAMRDAEPGLNRDRGCRKRVIRRRGCEHDQVEALRVDSRMRERRLRGA